MNILSTGSLHPCTSCQMCAVVCPKDAITIELDELGFYRPVLHKDRCIDCGVCTKVCYKYKQIAVTSEASFPNIDVWAAKSKEAEILAETTSGGVADILVDKLISLGYICCGVIYDYKENIARNKIAVNRKETLEFRGSKYIQSYTFSAFKELVLNYPDQKIAIFGTPCHIFAIDQYLTFKKKRKNALLIDFYCHGCPTINLWKKYVKENFASYSTDLCDIKFRSKRYGWGVYCIEATGKGGYKFSSRLVNNDFYTLFFSDHVLNESCHMCELRHSLEYTDIRIGDFWGKQYDLDRKGVSIISPMTLHGKEIFELVKEKMEVTRHQQCDVVPFQSWKKIYKPNRELRKQLLYELSDDKYSLRHSINLYYHKMSIKKRIIMFLKNYLLYLPIPVYSVIKKMYH